MATTVETDKTGDKGEYLAALLLSEVALVNRYQKDWGLDFYCELRDHAGVSFYVQAKGSAKPIYAITKPTISSLPVNCQTINGYWLKQPSPVFVLMSDTTANKTYYALVDENTYKPELGQRTYTFSIPLSNEIARDNIGHFVKVVIEKQRLISSEERERRLEEHYLKNPELYHDLDEIERFLEVMRGSDQTAQLEVKSLLKQRCEAGMLIASRLADGLKSIFINCKDSVTQHHVLDILLLVNDGTLIPLVLKQIERNMRLYEFRPYGYETGLFTYTDFLFTALVKLNATDKAEEIKRFLGVKDATINRGAIRACGELGINSAISDVMRFLGHPNDGVRYDAAQALSKLDSSKVVPNLEKVLQTSQGKLEIAGAIQTLAEAKNTQAITTILPLADDPSRDVRKAVALYLGATNPVGHISLLLNLMVDDDHEVRSEAMRSVHRYISAEYSGEVETPAISQSPPLSVEELEQIALPLLKKVYANGQLQQTVSLLLVCKGPSSLPTLVDIYFREEGVTKQVEVIGPSGNVEGVQFIDLKASVLDILKQYDLPEIRDDIIKQITANPANHKYIAAAGELRLEEAFNPLTDLFDQESLEDTGPIVSALVSINSVKARVWAINTLRNNPPFGVSLACIEILSRNIAEDERSLVKAQIHRLMNDFEARRNPRIYFYVCHYGVTETVPIIVNDLGANFDTLVGPVKYRMLETAMGLDAPRSRDVMIKVLPIVDDTWKHVIIASLGEIGDPVSIATIREYKDHPSLEISKLVEKILSRTSTA